MADELPTYMTPAEVVEYLASQGIEYTLDGVRAWCRRGNIDSIKLPGGKWRIHRDHVLAILTGQPATTAPTR